MGETHNGIKGKSSLSLNVFELVYLIKFIPIGSIVFVITDFIVLDRMIIYYIPYSE